MALIRYRDLDPFKELSKLLEWNPVAKWFEREGAEFRFPALDVEDREDSLVVKAEVPGVKPGDMEIELHGDQLFIRGEKKEEKEEKDEEKKYYYKERSYGSFSRTVGLGVEVDPEDIDARYKDGVLTITLKKMQAKRARKIEIKE
jgi:HSP20 family protein